MHSLYDHALDYLMKFGQDQKCFIGDMVATIKIASRIFMLGMLTNNAHMARRCLGHSRTFT